MAEICLARGLTIVQMGHASLTSFCREAAESRVAAGFPGQRRLGSPQDGAWPLPREVWNRATNLTKLPRPTASERRKTEEGETAMKKEHRLAKST